MSTMTVERVPLDRGARTPQVPERAVVPTPPLRFPLSGGPRAVVQVPRPRIVVDREDDGTFLVSVRDGLVVGVGSTASEALSRFWVELREHVEYLRRNRSRLHPGMASDMAMLEQDFPWL